MNPPKSNISPKQSNSPQFSPYSSQTQKINPIAKSSSHNSTLTNEFDDVESSPLLSTPKRKLMQNASSSRSMARLKIDHSSPLEHISLKSNQSQNSRASSFNQSKTLFQTTDPFLNTLPQTIPTGSPLQENFASNSSERHLSLKNAKPSSADNFIPPEEDKDFPPFYVSDSVTGEPVNWFRHVNKLWDHPPTAQDAQSLASEILGFVPEEAHGKNSLFHEAYKEGFELLKELNIALKLVQEDPENMRKYNLPPSASLFQLTNKFIAKAQLIKAMPWVNAMDQEMELFSRIMKPAGDSNSNPTFTQVPPPVVRPFLGEFLPHLAPSPSPQGNSSLQSPVTQSPLSTIGGSDGLKSPLGGVPSPENPEAIYNSITQAFNEFSLTQEQKDYINQGFHPLPGFSKMFFDTDLVPTRPPDYLTNPRPLTQSNLSKNPQGPTLVSNRSFETQPRQIGQTIQISPNQFPRPSSSPAASRYETTVEKEYKAKLSALLHPDMSAVPDKVSVDREKRQLDFSPPNQRSFRSQHNPAYPTPSHQQSSSFTNNSPTPSSNFSNPLRFSSQSNSVQPFQSNAHVSPQGLPSQQARNPGNTHNIPLQYHSPQQSPPQRYQNQFFSQMQQFPNQSSLSSPINQQWAPHPAVTPPQQPNNSFRNSQNIFPPMSHPKPPPQTSNFDFQTYLASRKPSKKTIDLNKFRPPDRT